MDSAMSPVPSDEEAAAIVTALMLVGPAGEGADDGAVRRAAPWRFSGRWWSQPIPLRRARPWV